MADYDFGENFINISSSWFDKTFHNDDKKEKSAESHQAANATGEGGSYQEQAEAIIRGYPGLKAKTCVKFAGVGAGSGKWYCKVVEQGWSKEDGYVTKMSLLRGKGGGGDSGNNQEPDSRSA